MLKYLDLFAGIGGFSRGIEQAGVKIESHYYSEIDKYAKSIYKRHWPEATDLGAVEHIRGGDYEPFDLVTFGFPCQDISIAGKRAGLEGSRSNLFYQAMRIIRENKPRGFILENVQGLFSSNEGKDFIAVLREIANIGLYECQWQLVNTSWFLPQNRERVIIAGHSGGERGPEVFPIAETNTVHPGESGEDSIVNCLDSSYGKGWKDKGQRTMIYQVPRGNNPGGILNHDYAPTMGSENSYQHNALLVSPTIRAEHHNTADVHFIEEMVIANTVTPDAYLARGERERIDGKPSKDPTPMYKRRIRRLTPTECCRLQGFPDDWCDWGIDEKGNRVEISDTQKYRCLGNAVSTNVIEKIIRKWFIDG